MNHLEARVDAVLFDVGGTLFSYACLRPGTHEVLVRLCAAAQLRASNDAVAAAYVAALKPAFTRYLPRSFHLMRDLFGDAAVDTIEWLTALSHVARVNRQPGGADLLRDLEDAVPRETGAAAVTCDPFLAATAADFWLHEGVVETLAALRARTVRVGLLTNMDVDELERDGEIEVRVELRGRVALIDLTARLLDIEAVIAVGAGEEASAA
jgi:FMN phosphatase YigB (HAD superfamily)